MTDRGLNIVSDIQTTLVRLIFSTDEIKQLKKEEICNTNNSNNLAKTKLNRKNRYFFYKYAIISTFYYQIIVKINSDFEYCTFLYH